MATTLTDEKCHSETIPTPSASQDVENNALSSCDAPQPSSSLCKLSAQLVSPDDPYQPRTWTERRKTSMAILVSFSQLVALMSASVIAPALSQIAQDVGLTTSAAQVAFSVYLLGLGLGPFLIAACSETFGRRPVWIFSHLFYILWNSLCPVGNSSVLMITGRLMSGFGASVGISLSAPIVADMYGPEKRGRSLAVATFAPYFGPAVGPIIGGLMTQHISWHWSFWLLSIFDAAVVLLGFCFLRETYAPVLQRRAAHLLKTSSDVGNGALTTTDTNLLDRFLKSLARPVLLLYRRPVIQLLSLLLGLNFGIYTIILSTFAALWIEKYQESTTISSLHYIAIAIGCTVSSQGGGHLTDFVWRRLKRRAGGHFNPEYRVPIMLPGLVLMPIGLIWYGWSAEHRLSWIMVDIAVVIFTLGSFLWAQAMLAYLLDEFVQYAASANAASRMFVYLLGFAFPIFAPDLYEKLGYGWGNTLLALIIIGLGWISPILLWKFGARLRAAGRREGEVD
ncbi:hypothetical protein DV736_g4230, partial [Chaetothyriales sp. CBS 134916]